MKSLIIILLLFSFQAESQTPMHWLRKKADGCNLVLDTYGSSTAAFSTYKVRTAYAGSCLRVRRSSDNTEQDIGFVGTCGDLDTTSMKTFVGTGGTDDGFVVTWYDQSGNGNNAAQATAANQPKIMDNGVVMRTDGQVAIFFTDGLLHFFSIPNIHGQSTVDAYVVQNYTPTQFIQFEGAGAGGNYSYVSTSGSGSTTLYSNYGTPSLYTDGNIFSGTTRGDVYTALNGYHISTYQAANVSSWSQFTFGGYSTFELAGYAGELIIWTSDQSANRAGILTKMNAKWGVY